MTLNIAFSLSETAKRQQEKIGLIEVRTGKKLTFGQLEQQSDDYAWHLHQNGVKPGDRVMLMVKPSADFICLTFALFKIGAPVILIDPGMGYKNLLRCIAGVAPQVFVGIPKAHCFLQIFRKSFRTIKRKFCCGKSFGIFGPDLRTAAAPKNDKYPIHSPSEKDLAAIIFTTGSTGPPKGVRYEHAIFSAQLKLIREYYKIGNTDTDQPAFPLFALFSSALGACAVIPDMDASRPAKVNPAKFVDSLIKNTVTYSFGSPALWHVVSNYCIAQQIRLTSLQKVLMAGAPVSGELVERVQAILPTNAEIHTPYGATESLPIVSIEGGEIINDTWPQTQQGKGTCVGRPLPGIEIRIVFLIDAAIESLDESMLLDFNEIGEIIVSGDVVTRAYENNPLENTMAKLHYDGRMWHRMGDTGYVDEQGRLWFCGRKAHRVQTAKGTMFTIQCEAITNTHPDIFRSALVGIADEDDTQKPVMILEVTKECQRSREIILDEIKEISLRSKFTKNIEVFLFHNDFPVDIRHNAKIFREKLQVWAEEKLANHE